MPRCMQQIAFRITSPGLSVDLPFQFMKCMIDFHAPIHTKTLHIPRCMQQIAFRITSPGLSVGLPFQFMKCMIDFHAPIHTKTLHIPRCMQQIAFRITSPGLSVGLPFQFMKCMIDFHAPIHTKTLHIAAVHTTNCIQNHFSWFVCGLTIPVHEVYDRFPCSDSHQNSPHCRGAYNKLHSESLLLVCLWVYHSSS